MEPQHDLECDRGIRNGTPNCDCGLDAMEDKIAQLEHDLGDLLCLLRGDTEHRQEMFDHYKARYPEYGLDKDLIANVPSDSR